MFYIDWYENPRKIHLTKILYKVVDIIAWRTPTRVLVGGVPDATEPAEPIYDVMYMLENLGGWKSPGLLLTSMDEVNKTIRDRIISDFQIKYSQLQDELEYDSRRNIYSGDHLYC